jgi:Na+/H+-dicarboxylate symporter
MKTWIIYPAAVIFGLAATLLLQDWQLYARFLDVVVPAAIQIGLYVLFPVVFVLFTSAVASLRRYKETFLVFSSALFWGLVTAIVLSLSGMALAMFLPFEFVSPGSAPFSDYPLYTFSSFFSLFIAENAFVQLTQSTTTLLPIMVLALVIGLALRPDREAIRPAYVVVNSFAEAMIRLARVATVIGAALMLLISAHWFLHMPTEMVLSSGNLLFSLGLLIAVVASIFLILPLLFGLFTLFKGGNPYSILLGALGAILATGFSGNMLFGTTPLLALTQQNCGVRKRVGGITTPLLTILGRGGSAMVTTYAIIKLLQFAGISLSVQTMLFIAIFSALFSLGSAFSLGFELVFISFMILQSLQADIGIFFSSGMVLMLPILRIGALLIDAAVNVFGTTFGSRLVSPDDTISIDEMM